MNKPSFDVSKEPCIPVIREGELEYVSLRDALVNAHECLEIQNPLLTVEFGLYRLLIALMGDIFFVERGKSLNTVHLGELLKQGKFDPSRVDEYFAKYAGVEINRFDLFSETHPFMQVVKPPEKEKPKKQKSSIEQAEPTVQEKLEDKREPSSIAQLIPSIPSGTNTIHFHHSEEDDFVVCPMVGLWLLTTIAPFSGQSGRGFPMSINDNPPIYALILGRNLFETICFNFCTLPIDGASKNDLPSWRWQNNRPVGELRSGSGYLESLTWMPRKVTLIPKVGGICQVTQQTVNILIKSVYWAKGDKIRVKGEKNKTKRLFEWFDPNVAYRFSEKEKRFVPICLQREKEIWRDSVPLFLMQKKERVAKRPQVIDQFLGLVANSTNTSKMLIDLKIYALSMDQAKIIEWRSEYLVFPKQVAVHGDLYTEIVQDWINAVESTARVLVRSIGYLHPKRFKLENEARAKKKFRPWEESRGDGDVFESRSKHSERKYWSNLRLIFQSLLFQLAALEIITPETRKPLREKWRKDVTREARTAFDKAVDGLEVNNHALERIVRARRGLEAGLKQVFEPANPSEKAKLKVPKPKKEGK